LAGERFVSFSFQVPVKFGWLWARTGDTANAVETDNATSVRMDISVLSG
jgi:hypothetical protein